MTIRRDPFDAMDRMFEQLRRSMQDEWMDEDRPALGDARTDVTTRADMTTSMDANLRAERTDEGYLVMADLPGFEKEDITVRFEDVRLSITAESDVSEGDETTLRRRNRRTHEELRIPETVEEADVSATYRNGVLEITVPIEADETRDEHVIDIE